jgi:hypothetical protein
MTNKYSDGKFTFSIIRHHNSPNDAVTADGVKVYRSSKIFVPEWVAYIRCAPYDTHFIYEDKSNKVGRWALMCTCGSPAIIVGYNVYKKDASNSGAMIVCNQHASTGRHVGGAQ